MKNKAPLSLIEQVIMILVFALTAAFCLQGFALASKISLHQEIQSKSVIAVQNAAEILKNTAGDLEASASKLGGFVNDHTWTIPYDASWQPISAQDDYAYLLSVSIYDSGVPYLGTANIRIIHDNEVVFTITTAWQEDDTHEIKK